MDVQIVFTRCPGGLRFSVAGVALAATLVAAPPIAAAGGIDAARDVAVKAALLYNFAKFVEWPALPSGAPLIVCFVGDDRIAVVFADTVRGKSINDHALNISRPQDSTTWRLCNLLYIPDAETARSAAGMNAIKTLPILTVSDRTGFSQAGGIIELYLDDGRMHFAINVDAAERSGLRVSSRLLGLAKVVRNSHVQ